MKPQPIALVSALALMAALSGSPGTAQAQTDGSSPAQTTPPNPQHKSAPGGGTGDENRPPKPPLDQVLDVNGDGVIDADEIAHAAESLRKLDKNGDGQLSEDEYRPARPEGQGRRRPPSGAPRPAQPPTEGVQE